MSWSTAALGDVCDIVSGATPKTSEARFWGGAVLWTTPKDLSGLETPYIEAPPRTITEEGLKSCAASVLPENSVLLSSRAPIGLVAINTMPMATNQGFKSLVPHPRRVDSQFLYFWLKSKTQYLQSLGNGATFKELSKAVVERIEIPLPPVDEQRRIAAILDKADVLRRKRKRALELLDGLTQSVFLEMFGSEQDEGRRALAEIVDGSDRINYGVVQPGEHDENGVFLVRVSDLSGGAVNHTSLRKVSKPISDAHRRSLLKGNEILVSCVGSIGEISVATERERGFNIARAVARVPIVDPFLRAYVAEYLRSPRVKRYFTKELRTVSQPTLNIKQIAETEIAVPGRQRLIEFSQAAANAQKSREIATKLSEQTDYLFLSLQHRAFTGQL